MPQLDLCKKWSIIELRNARRVKRANHIKERYQESFTQSLEGHYIGIPQLSLQIHVKRMVTVIYEGPASSLDVLF